MLQKRRCAEEVEKSLFFTTLKRRSLPDFFSKVDAHGQVYV